MHSKKMKEHGKVKVMVKWLTINHSVSWWMANRWWHPDTLESEFHLNTHTNTEIVLIQNLYRISHYLEYIVRINVNTFHVLLPYLSFSLSLSFLGLQMMHVKMKWKRTWVKLTQWLVNNLYFCRVILSAESLNERFRVQRVELHVGSKNVQTTYIYIDKTTTN